MRGRGEPCYVVDKVTGEVASEHPSITDAARLLGMHATASKQVKARRLFNRCRYAIRVVGDYDPHESFEGKRSGVPVMCVYRDHVDVYEDLALVQERLMFSHSTLSMAIRTGTRKVGGEFRVAYLPRMGACNELIARGLATVHWRDEEGK